MAVTKWLVWPIRVLATIEAVDALWFMSDAGWSESEPILVALAVGGLIGLPLVWLAGSMLKPEWLWLGVGALLVAVAPAMIYPLSFLLFMASIVVIALGVSSRSRAPHLASD